MSRWNRILALTSSNLFSRYWTLARRMLGRGGQWAWTLSLFRTLLHFPQCFLLRFHGDASSLLFLFLACTISGTISGTISCTISAGHSGSMEKVSQKRFGRPELMSKCVFYLYVVSANAFVQKKMLKKIIIDIIIKCTIFAELSRQRLDTAAPYSLYSTIYY